MLKLLPAAAVAACIGQMAWSVVRLIAISEAPPEMWVAIHTSSNLHMFLAALGSVCVVGLWEQSRWGLYGFLGVAALNLALALAFSHALVALLSAGALVSLILIAKGARWS